MNPERVCLLLEIKLYVGQELADRTVQACIHVVLAGGNRIPGAGLYGLILIEQMMGVEGGKQHCLHIDYQHEPCRYVFPPVFHQSVFHCSFSAQS